MSNLLLNREVLLDAESPHLHGLERKASCVSNVAVTCQGSLPTNTSDIGLSMDMGHRPSLLGLRERRKTGRGRELGLFFLLVIRMLLRVIA